MSKNTYVKAILSGIVVIAILVTVYFYFNSRKEGGEVLSNNEIAQVNSDDQEKGEDPSKQLDGNISPVNGEDNSAGQAEQNSAGEEKSGVIPTLEPASDKDTLNDQETSAADGNGDQKKPPVSSPIGNTKETPETEPATKTEPTPKLDNSAVKITKSEISSNAKFYPYKIDGINMELLAVKATDGTIRTALNTCQVCYDSGRGYYKQAGDYLVCQNCGNRFHIDQIEKIKGGCNPVPVLEADKQDAGDYITISKDFMKSKKELFNNWKKG